MKGLILCVCQGTCPSFQNMNIFEILNILRRKELVDFVAIHPQLCADDGDNFLYQITKEGNNIDKLIIAGCDPKMQVKMFRDAFEKAGFDKTKHIGVDIRNMNTEQALEAITQKIVET